MPGGRRKALVVSEVEAGRTFFDKACVAASDNFLHGGIIIGSFYGFNIKFAIVLL